MFIFCSLIPFFLFFCHSWLERLTNLVLLPSYFPTVMKTAHFTFITLIAPWLFLLLHLCLETITALECALCTWHFVPRINWTLSQVFSIKHSSMGKVQWPVTSWILRSIHPNLVSNILYGNSNKDVWDDLCDCFHQPNAPRLFQIKQVISSLHQEKLSISAYFTRLKALWDEQNSL